MRLYADPTEDDALIMVKIYIRLNQQKLKFQIAYENTTLRCFILKSLAFYKTDSYKHPQATLDWVA